jgi:uncharacterized protein (TIGR03545 family)
MRWTYLLPRAILVGLVWAFFQYGFDPLLRQGLTLTGERIARAKVEIADVATTFFPPSFRATQVKVADRGHPGTNLVEFGELRGQLELQPLLKRSFIVNEATVRGLKWGTPRSDSGLLPDEPPDMSDDTGRQFLENVKHELLARGKDWLAGLSDRARLEFSPNQFETVRLGQELEARWPKEFDRYEADLTALKSRIEELRSMLRTKGGNELAKIERYTQAARDVDALLREIEQLRQQFAQTMRQAQDDLQALSEAKSRDLVKIKEKVDLLHLDPDEVTEFLLGPELTHRLQTALDWMGFVRQRVELATDDPKPVRSRGETILFHPPSKLPAVLIRLMNLEGEGEFSGERLAFQGTVSNVTSQPKLIGKPIVIRIEGAGADISAPAANSASPIELAAHQSRKAEAAPTLNVQLKAVLDYTQAVPEHKLLLTYQEPRPDTRAVGKSDSIQLAINSRGTGCFADLTMVGDKLSGQVDFQQALESITAKLGTKRFSGDERVLAVIQDVVSGVRKITARLQVSGTALKPGVKLRSTLGQELSAGINTAFARQLEAGRRELLVRFEQETTKQSAKLTRLYDEQWQKLTGDLKFNRDEIQQIAQAFGLKLPGKIDLQGVAEKLPIDLQQPLELKTPLDLKEIGKSLPKPDMKLPQFGLQPDATPAPKIPGLEKDPKLKSASDAVRQAGDVTKSLEDLGLFPKKKTAIPKSVQPAAGQQPASRQSPTTRQSPASEK